MTLPETATTGYRWEPDVDAGALRVVDTHPEAPVEPRGAPGQRVVTVEALRRGPADLRLLHKRSWEQQATKTFSVRLDVHNG